MQKINTLQNFLTTLKYTFELKYFPFNMSINKW